MRKKTGKVIVVAGDITIDWNIARINKSDTPARIWNADDLTGVFSQPGGAALLANLIEVVAANLSRSKHTDIQVNQIKIPGNIVNPQDKRFHHSFTQWAPYRFDEKNPADKRKVWRVREFMGLHRASVDMSARDDWRKVFNDSANTDLVVLDDAALGFRDQKAFWPAAIMSNRVKPWVLLKMARPIARGQLWDHLYRDYADKLIAVMTINDLRSHPDINISRQISWERTAQDLAWELFFNPSINALTQCLHIIVSLGTAGAVLISRKQKDIPSALLIYDPATMEGEWEINHKGNMIGYTTCLTAGIVRELLLNSSDPELLHGIQCGIHAMRHLHIEGFGDASGDLDKYPLAFPTIKIADSLAQDGIYLPAVRVKSPAQVLTATAGKIDDAVQQSFWTILEDQNPDSLENVSSQIVREGLEHALTGVPLRRFGGLVTVDRKEIEALNSVGNLIREYCQQPSRKPLSIAVFGPPGSGKSFAIKQIANSLMPGEIGELTFNLSQFGDPSELFDAFHQIRDKALSGKLPLVFWDEFDTALKDVPLGWLRYFLAPMQDGEFQEGQLVHPLGRSIFIFAGGTSYNVEAFGADLDEEKRRSVKLPDFISRIKGALNVFGPNRQTGINSLHETGDPYYIIRRAVLLRSIFERNTSQIFTDSAGRKILNIDEGLLHAFLLIPEYRHGARSIESIVAMSQLTGKTSFERSSLPTESQLDLHLDGRKFYELMYRLNPDAILLENLAAAAHEVFCDNLRERGYKYGAETHSNLKIHSSLKTYAELPEDEKEQNRGSVRDIPNKLAAIGYTMLPARGTEKSIEFNADEIEKLAELEHERWVKQKLDSGWKYAKRTDKSKKFHKDIVTWNRLTDVEKDKDRVLVKGISRIIRKAGYVTVKLGKNNE